MRKILFWAAAVLFLVALPLTSCGPASNASAQDPKPIKVERLNSATEPTRETLTADAAKRLDIQSAPAVEVVLAGQPRTVIPYAGLLYDTNGNTWIYINSAPLTFIRHRVTVDHIQGDQVFLSDSLSPGTKVVIVGAEELYGSEFEFKEE
jgi:hypothetical protein